MFYKNPVFWLLASAFILTAITNSLSLTMICLGFTWLYHKSPLELKKEVIEKEQTEISKVYDEIEKSRARLTLEELHRQERAVNFQRDQDEKIRNTPMSF